METGTIEIPIDVTNLERVKELLEEIGSVVNGIAFLNIQDGDVIFLNTTRNLTEQQLQGIKLRMYDALPKNKVVILGPDMGTRISVLRPPNVMTDVA